VVLCLAGLVAATVLTAAWASSCHRGLPVRGPGHGSAVARNEFFPHPPAAPTKVEVGGRLLAEVVSDLEILIPELMEREGVPGLSVALIADGRIVWVEGFGVKDTRTGEPVTTVSVFRGASLTKQLVAYAALKMCEQGVLELDRPLTDYLEEPYLDDHRVEQVTLRMVLSHTSGFSHSGYGRGGIWFTPGDHFSYSNHAFLYLQHVIETVSGMSFETYMAENVFGPLGMAETSLVWVPAYQTLSTIGHNDLEPVEPYRPVEAHGAFGILTTPTDYAKLLIELMAAAEGDEHRLSREAVGLMVTPEVAAGRNLWWGLGVGLQKTQSSAGDGGEDDSPDSGSSTGTGALDLWQWGWITGYRNYMTASLEQRVGIVIMTNGSGGLGLCEEIVVAALGRSQPSFPGMLDFFLD